MNMNSGAQGMAPASVATKSRTWIAVLITVIVLSLGTAGAAWGFLRYSSSPEAKILASFEKLEAVKTFAYDGKIVAKGEVEKMKDSLSFSLPTEASESTAPEFTKAELEVNFSGKSDLSIKENGASESSFNFLAKDSEKTYPAFGFDFVSKEKAMAFRIPSIPVVGEFDLSELNNQWISIDLKKLEEQLGSFLPPEAATKIKTLEDSKETTKIIESLKKSAALRPPIKVTKRFKSETIDGVRTQPYAFVVNKKNTEMIIDKLAQFEKETGVTKEDAIEMKKALQQVNKFEGTIWLATKTGLPHRIKLSSQFVEPENKKPVDVTLALNMKEFNKQMSISFPTNTMSIEDAFSKVMEKLLGPKMGDDLFGSEFSSSTDMLGLPSSTDTLLPPSGTVSGANRPSPTEDSDGDGLSDYEESFYGTSVTSKDTDGDGYDDKTEISNGHDPLKASTTR